MIEADRAARSLDVDGSLTIATPGGSLTLGGRGARIRLSASSFRALLALGRSQPLGRRAARGASLATIDRALRFSGLTLDLDWRGRTIARTGSGSRPSRLARLLGWPAVQLVPFAPADSNVGADEARS